MKAQAPTLTATSPLNSTPNVPIKTSVPMSAVTGAAGVSPAAGTSPTGLSLVADGTNGSPHFEGNVLCQTEVSLETGATMNGRVLAQTQIAPKQATVVQPTEP